MRTNAIVINSMQYAAILSLIDAANEAQHVVEHFAQHALSHDLTGMHAEASALRKRLKDALIECRAESVAVK